MTARITVADLTEGERARFALLLLSYFPEVGTDEPISGSDAVDALGELYRELGGEPPTATCLVCDLAVGIEEAVSTYCGSMHAECFDEHTKTCRVCDEDGVYGAP